jgi:hypothetical protein
LGRLDTWARASWAVFGGNRKGEDLDCRLGCLGEGFLGFAFSLFFCFLFFEIYFKSKLFEILREGDFEYFERQRSDR